jgi:diguanylate cyclase (GGDEF)-like protein
MLYFYSLILIFLIVVLYAVLRSFLDRNILQLKSSYDNLKARQNQLISEKEIVKKGSEKLKKALEETVELYEITKQITKSLEEEKVFAYFKEEVKKYLELNDCFFLKTDADINAYKDCVILPVEINRVIFGYLAARGVKKEGEEKFNILAQQCLLGVRRALLYQQVQELAITDSLTGIFTRKHYLERLAEEIDYSRQFNYPFSLLMLDIDHFKGINDHYGHLVGDAVLRFVAKLIKDNLRQVDLLCRYGGEEFSIILTNTDKDGAKLAAERIRQSVENSPVKVYDEDLKVTISIGVTTFPGDARNSQKLIETADKALYKAKQNGRNQVCT